MPVIPGARSCRFAATSTPACDKLDDGEFDALVLAAAGMRRLGVGDRISAALPFDLSVPAPGQGIIAIETRRDDTATREAVSRLHDADAGVA